MELPLDLSIRKSPSRDLNIRKSPSLDLNIRKSPSPATDDAALDTGNDDTDVEDFSLPSTSVIIPEDISTNVTQQQGNISVSLVDANVWKAFSSKGTEMIINRSGRRMFPHVTIAISGLASSGLYNIWLEVVPADDRRYKYVSNDWMSVSQADPNPPAPPYLHPDSPNTGSFWMQKKISFARPKLTNNRDSAEGNILLQSMHKYKAQIHISGAGNEGHNNTTVHFSFDETTFIAVTAYQNDNITKMKIHNNPFAKAFRDKHLSLKSRSKMSSTPVGEQDKCQIRRKRKFSETQSSTGITANYSQPLQLTTSSASPWGLDVLAAGRPNSSPVCNVSSGLHPLYRPYHHVTQQAVWPVSPLMFPSHYLLSANPHATSPAHCSTTSSLPYYRSAPRCENEQS